jgi:histone H3/H4
MFGGGSTMFGGDTYRFQSSAMLALQEASEDFLEDVFTKAYAATVICNESHTSMKHMKLAVRMICG